MNIDLLNPVNLTLPVLESHDYVAIPNNECRVDLTEKADIYAISVAENYNNYLVIVFNPVEGITKETVEGYYKRAVIAKIVLHTAPSSSFNRVKFEIVMRCDINSIEATSGALLANVTTVPSIISNVDELNVTKGLIIKEMQANKDLSDECHILYQKLSVIFSKPLDDHMLADVLGGTVSETNMKDRLQFVMEDDATVRLRLVLEILRRVKLYDDLEKSIDERVRKNMNDAQREYYLREKMRAIQEELGDKVQKESEIEDLRKQIKNAGLPKTVEEKCLNELGRFQMMSSASPEAGIIKTYLDFVLSLPWNTQSEDCNDIVKAREILDADHYGLDKIKERIIEYLSVKILTKKNPQSILCLVGPPGVGKSSLAKSIAKALNKRFVKQSLGGMKDESEIRGHRRTYIGALPGRILQSLAKCGTNNPVFLLDEIDKMSSDYKGDPTSAMLEVLDPEQNSQFSDNYLEEPFDLSNCFFIATANYLYNIPAPLRDRLEIINLSSYTEQEKFEITKRHLIPKQLKANGLEESQFEITDEAIMLVIQKYTREAGVREVERLIGALVRKAVCEVLQNNLKKVVITKDNLESYLGKFKFENTENTGKDLVGVVTGLAYTEFGGDTLQIEVVHYPGNGKVMLTGKLGDVMKESAETALSFVKANCEILGIDYELFNKNDIHIHVPEGAVPKDGPSAGVTMTTAIVSSFSGRPVDHLVGMTGEITLRGRVLPIGGLKEKSIAAHRSGLKTILVPKENSKDIDEIPESVRESLKIILIENAADALKVALK